MAQELANIGPTFEIKEQDLEEVINNKLTSPEGKEKIEQFNIIWQEKVRAKTQRPTPVKNIGKATESRKYRFDPSTSIPNDLHDHNGKVFYKANTKVNPLEHVKLPQPMLFIDGDDQTQIDFINNYEQENMTKTMLILINGEPFKLMQELKREVYFDQGGFMVGHFAIKHVPAVITQEDQYLVIEEVVL